MNDGSGPPSRMPFAAWSRRSSSWRTSPDFCEGDSHPSSVSWPKWGTMRSGACYRRESWDSPIRGSGSSSWRTVHAQEPGYSGPYYDKDGNPKTDPTGRFYDEDGVHKNVGVRQQYDVMREEWGTPQANPRTHSARDVDHGKQIANQAEETWPTAAARESKGINPEHLVNKDGEPWTPGEKPYDARTGNPVTTSLHQTVKYLASEEGERWPTAQSRDHKGGTDWSKRTRGGEQRPEGDMTLPDRARHQMWGTPAARDWKDGSLEGMGDAPTNCLLGRQAPRKDVRGDGSLDGGRRLNPRFVEWLMGLPIGWSNPTTPSTDEQSGYAASAMRSYLSKQRWLLRCLLDAPQSDEDDG